MDWNSYFRNPPAAPKVAPTVTEGRARAENGTTPKATRIRFSDVQFAKLERLAKARHTSIAQIVRDLVDGAA